MQVVRHHDTGIEEHLRKPLRDADPSVVNHRSGRRERNKTANHLAKEGLPSFGADGDKNHPGSCIVVPGIANGVAPAVGLNHAIPPGSQPIPRGGILEAVSARHTPPSRFPRDQCFQHRSGFYVGAPARFARASRVSGGLVPLRQEIGNR